MGGIMKMELTEETSSFKFCFDVLHIKNKNRTIAQTIRTKNTNAIKNILKDEMNCLDTDIIPINEKQDLLSFVKNNPSFCIDPNGFDYKLGGTTETYYRYKEVDTGWIYPEIQTLANTYSVLKNFCNSKYDNLVIFEDHLSINDNFYELLNLYFNQLPEDFDIFFQNAPKQNLKKAKSVSELICETPTLTVGEGYACYVLSKNSAKKILNYFEQTPGVFLPTTWFYIKTDFFKCYSPLPRLDQGCSLSDIDYLDSWDINNRIKLNFFLEGSSA